MEFHGDRYFKDDGAIVGGVAMFHGMPVTVIGQQKGKNTKGQHHPQLRNAVPDGYRKALRLMKQAETFRTSGSLLCGYAGSFLRTGGRGEGTGRGHCQKPVRDI
ncbi:MAG: hypothetical protein ACLR0U_23785 [Enterocloster clostridioformis]